MPRRPMRLEKWQRSLRAVWRARKPDGTPYVTDETLAALRLVVADGRHLLTGAPAIDARGQCYGGRPMVRGCLAGHIARCNGASTVDEVNGFFVPLCAAIDATVGHDGAWAWLTRWFDFSGVRCPSRAVRHALLIEIALERDRRSMLRGCAGDVQRQPVGV